MYRYVDSLGEASAAKELSKFKARVALVKSTVCQSVRGAHPSVQLCPGASDAEQLLLGEVAVPVYVPGAEHHAFALVSDLQHPA